MLWSKKSEVDSISRWSAVSAFVGVLLFNGLAGSSTVLGGKDTAGISEAFPTLFTPSGITFAIWGVIYLLLVGFCLYAYGVGRSKKPAIKPEQLNSVLQWFTVSSVLNVLWIIAWQYQIFWLSALIIAGLLYTLVKINEILRGTEPLGKEYVLLKLPFSLYFGWITVATIANISVWLVSLDWDGFGIRPGIWTVGVLLLGALVGLAAAVRNADPAYLAVFIWAYAGILLKHLAADGYNGMYPTVMMVLAILLSLFLSAWFQMVLPSMRRNLQKYT